MSGSMEKAPARPKGVSRQQARKNERAELRKAVRRIVSHSPIDDALLATRQRIVATGECLKQQRGGRIF